MDEYNLGGQVFDEHGSVFDEEGQVWGGDEPTQLPPFIELELLAQSYNTSNDTVTAVLRWKRNKADVNPAIPAFGRYRYRKQDGTWSSWLQLGSVDSNADPSEMIPADEIWGEFTLNDLEYSTTYEVQAQVYDNEGGRSDFTTLVFTTYDEPTLDPPVITTNWYGTNRYTGVGPALNYTWGQELVGPNVRVYARYLIGPQTFDDDGNDISNWGPWILKGTDQPTGTVTYANPDFDFGMELHLQMYAENDAIKTEIVQEDYGAIDPETEIHTTGYFETDELRRDWIKWHAEDDWEFDKKTVMVLNTTDGDEHTYILTNYGKANRTSWELQHCLQCNYLPDEVITFTIRTYRRNDDGEDVLMSEFVDTINVPRPVLGLIAMPDGSKRVLTDICYVKRNTTLPDAQLDKSFVQFLTKVG